MCGRSIVTSLCKTTGFRMLQRGIQEIQISLHRSNADVEDGRKRRSTRQMNMRIL